MKIGIRLESLKLPLRRGLEEAQRMGSAGVEVDAVGDLAPKALSETGRRELRRLLRIHSLEPSVLGCPLRRGLDVAENLDARIDHVKNVMALSYDLGARIVLIEVGRVAEPSPLLLESLRALASHGDRIGTVLALEAGLEAGETLKNFLARFDTASLGVNFDPANLLLHGFDPYESAKALRGRIVHVHARDARAARASKDAQEVPLGHGDIDWLQFLGVLEEIEYRGWLTIVRQTGDNRLADVAAGVTFLRRFIPAK